MVTIVFFGTSTFAVPTLDLLLESQHDVVAVVTRPDRPRGRGHRIHESPVKARARASSVQVLQPERMKDPAFLEQVATFSADLGVVASYGKILPDVLLETPRFGMINVHASLLPKYRGAAPIHRAILAGERETGVTIIRLVRELDAGPMLKQRARLIKPEETSEDLETILAKQGANLLLEAIADLEAGRESPEEQEHQCATLAPRLIKEDGIIDWTEPASMVHNQVRGLHPWPHAYTYLDGKRYLILQCNVCAITRPATVTNSTPGEVLEAKGESFIVAAGDNSAVAILKIQPEGRRAVSARAFLAGHRIRIGSIFLRRLL